MSLRHSASVLLVGVLAITACDRKREGAAQPPPHVATSASAVRSTSKKAPGKAGLLPRGNAELPTTSGSIFFGNLEGQVLLARQQVAEEPSSAKALKGLAGLLYGLARHHGDLDEIDESVSLLSRAVTLDPNDGEAYLMRAEQEQSLHRFAAARADLERARAKGAAGERLDAGVRELDYSEGKYDVAIPALKAASAAHTDVRTVARAAFLEHELGDDEAAERLFQQAEDLVVDTNPIPLAWLNVQRGIFASQRGQLDRAVLFFREAVRRTPGYVPAEEHLAEVLAENGQVDEAVTLYESIVARSSDPEFMGALAALYRQRGRTAEADALARKAKEGFERLIKKYPEAMAGHATEFFLGEGKDPRRARGLATTDARLRPTARAFTMLARAELASNDVPAATRAIERALTTPLRSAETFWTAATVARARGDDAARATFEAQARALNPRIGVGGPG